MLLTDFLRKSTQKYSQKIAVKSREREISFEDLDKASNKIAGWLITKGCSSGDRIGIHLDRSVQGVIAIFGILKAGCAYVPIDITLPPNKKKYILKDCGISIILTDSKKICLLEDVLDNSKLIKDVLVLDDKDIKDKYCNKYMELEYLKEVLECNLSDLPYLKDNQLANILYTSGSTGEPKGVMINHDSLSQCINNEGIFFKINKDDVLSSTTPLHFSMSPFEIFTSIMGGATLSIVPPGLFSFPGSVASFIDKEKLTIWHSVPSVISQLVLYGKLPKKDFSKLRLVHLAGGPVPLGHIKKFMNYFPSTECYNVYGSAETYEISKFRMNELKPSAKSVPVGKPWKDVEMFLVDQKGDLVSKKEDSRGELYVRTPSMMTGYWNDKKRTNEVLIDNPFHSAGNNIKLYKTKDILKVDADGNFVLIGRADNTIKRGGFKIGLAEIESVLYGHAEIEEVSVVVNKSKKKYIYAFVVLKEDSSLDKESIREFCQKNLARYMVPDKIVIEDNLPKTSTGKVDKNRLSCKDRLTQEEKN